MDDNLQLGDIIKQTGDLGRFQILIFLFAEVCFIGHSWSVLFMAFGAAVPEHWCVQANNVSNTSTTSYNGTVSVCSRDNGPLCEQVEFTSSMRTIVSEFDLICERRRFTQTITTVQFTDILIGALVWGHIGDAIGRKPTLFIGLIMLSISNVIGYFSVNWQMFAAVRFLIGFSVAGINSAMVLFEFIRNKWRFWLGVVPFWSVWAGLLALFCWKVHDWREIHIAAAVTSALPVLAWSLIPESFRWLATRGRFVEAESVVQTMASCNGKAIANMAKVRRQLEAVKQFADREKSLRVYTVLDLFKSKQLLKTTLCFSFIWFSGMFAYFGIAFDVPHLSGNLYLNMFLVNIVDVPGNLLVAVVNIRFGRKWTSFWLYIFAGGFALAVGIFQICETEQVGTLKTAFVLCAKFFEHAGWVATATWTMESYPTVIRHIGKGFVDAVSRTGGMLAPQFIALSVTVPGLLYLVCGSILLLSGLMCVGLEETKDEDIADLLPQTLTATQEDGENDRRLEAD